MNIQIMKRVAGIFGLFAISGMANAVTQWYGPYVVDDIYWSGENSVQFRVVDGSGTRVEPPNYCANSSYAMIMNNTLTPSSKTYQLLFISYVMGTGIRIQLPDEAQTDPPGPGGCESNRPLVYNARLLD